MVAATSPSLTPLSCIRLLLATAVACGLALHAGASEASPANEPRALQLAMPRGAPPPAPRPLLHGGVMVLGESATALVVLDAVTGERLWRYEDAQEPAARGDALLALSDDLLVLATPGGRLLGFGLRHGDLRWRVAAFPADAGYRFATPPLAVDGRIVAPVAGCRPAGPQGCWVAAYDADSGAELWRRFLPAGASPSSAHAPPPAEAAVTWVSPIYDREVGSLFVALSASAPGGEPRRLVTCALDIETGAIEWLRREAPEDTPLDTASAR